MSKTHRSIPSVLKPRQLKKIRRDLVWQRMQREPLTFPEPDPPIWKPLG